MTAQEKAAEIWQAMDENEKTGVRFGMFPYRKMMEVEKEGFNGRELSVALMSQAGGMRA